MNRKKIIVISALTLIIVLGGLFIINKMKSNKERSRILIGFSIGDSENKEWQIVNQEFSDKVEEIGMRYKQVFADNDPYKQISQINDFVEDGAKVIIISAVDPAGVYQAVAKAKELGVKIISYDSLIENCDIDFCVSYDNVRAGQLQAQSMMSHEAVSGLAYLGGTSKRNNTYLMKDGVLNILNKNSFVVDEYVGFGNFDKAYQVIKNYLENGNLNGIIAVDESLTAGVMKALFENGLVENVLVSGFGSDLETCKRIATGEQLSTVYKSQRLLAQKTAEVAISMIENGSFDGNSILNNGAKDVPTYLLEPVMVDKENLTSVIVGDGLYEKEEIYQ